MEENFPYRPAAAERPGYRIEAAPSSPENGAGAAPAPDNGAGTAPQPSSPAPEGEKSGAARPEEPNTPAGEGQQSEPANPAWEHVQLARHPERPHALDYFQRIFTDFHELHGDRCFGDDHAVVGGFAFFEGEPVVVIGQQKGRDTKQKVYRNFGMSKPEGYRKALRLMQLAAKFGRPVFTFLDTPGAYPGVDAEERGQAEAIACNLRAMADLPVPLIVTCIAEGGSGGALGLGVGNRVLMLEHAYYSVISPESCAAIVWRDSSKAALAAQALKVAAADLLELHLIDEIVPEPPGGAHTDYGQAAAHLSAALSQNLARLKKLTPDELISERYTKFRQIGNFFEEAE